jgi:hypothetical protein
MRCAARFRGAVALWPLLAAHVVTAFEPLSVGIAIGAVSALTGYLSYTDFFCRFAECCREKPLNASGTSLAGGSRAASPRRSRRWVGGSGSRDVRPDSSLEAIPTETASAPWGCAQDLYRLRGP